MNKSSKKKGYDAKRALAVNQTATNYKVTPSYVRMCVNGDYTTPKAIEIKKNFNKLYSQLEKAMA